MTELRQDPATRNWIVVAPERSHRPDAFRQPDRAAPGAAVSCPFCPGREADTPPDIWRRDGPDGAWRVRVIPNKFPALAGEGHRQRHRTEQGFVSMLGVGAHEVVIEGPKHTGDLAMADIPLVRDVLEAYRVRYQALRARGAAVIIIFRNHGPSAGTSLAHPHSQIVAAPVVPLQIRHRFEVAMAYYDDLGTCLYRDILDRERADGRRIVFENDSFVAFQPFAAGVPFETWIMPRFHQSSFGDATAGALDALAPALQTVLGGLRDALGDPDYNYVINSAPPGEEAHEYFSWHLRIVPRLATPAGFELGSGMQINPSSPEGTAIALRRAIEHVPVG